MVSKVMTRQQLQAELDEYDSFLEIKIRGSGEIIDIEITNDGYLELIGEDNDI